MGEYEKRILTVNSIRTSMDEGEMRISGYAIKWAKWSVPLREKGSSFRERFMKGAFVKTIEQDDQFMFYAHDNRNVLARRSNGTLKLFEDDIGLKFYATFPNTTLGRDTYELVRRKDVSGISIGFRDAKDVWEGDRYTTTKERTVTKAILNEISIVTYPAYPSTEVGADNSIDSDIDKEQKKSKLLSDLEEIDRKIKKHQILDLLNK